MCGIVGAVLFNRGSNTDLISKINAYYFTSLLLETEERGKDATGVFVHYEDKIFSGIKIGVQASKLVGWDIDDIRKEAKFEDAGKEAKENEEIPDGGKTTYRGFLNEFWINNPTLVRSVLGHCRKKTKGTETNNNNNHPIIVGDIVGVHNGGVDNDAKIFDLHKNDFERIGEVDSEAIFQLMNLLHPKDKVGDEQFVKSVAQRVQIGNWTKDGTSAIAFHKKYPGVIYGFRKGARPLEIAFSKNLGVIFVISEQKFLKAHTDEYVVASIAGFDLPKANWEFESIKDDSGIIIDINKDINEVSGMKDILKQFHIPSLIESSYSNRTTSTVGANTKSTDKTSIEVDEEFSDFMKVVEKEIGMFSRPTTTTFRCIPPSVNHKSINTTTPRTEGTPKATQEIRNTPIVLDHATNSNEKEDKDNEGVCKPTIELFEKEGYTVNRFWWDEVAGMAVSYSCPQGHIGKVTIAGWKAGMRCPHCISESTKQEVEENTTGEDMVDPKLKFRLTEEERAFCKKLSTAELFTELRTEWFKAGIDIQKYSYVLKKQFVRALMYGYDSNEKSLEMLKEFIKWMFSNHVSDFEELLSLVKSASVDNKFRIGDLLDILEVSNLNELLKDKNSNKVSDNAQEHTSN